MNSRSDMTTELAPDMPSDPHQAAGLLRMTFVTQSEETASPLFAVHGAVGNAESFRSLAPTFVGRRSLYGIRAFGAISGEGEPDRSVGAMADRYVEVVAATHPAGPVSLCGYSLGGLVAIEMARRLRGEGREIPLVVLLDTNPELAFPLRAQRLANVRSHLRRHGSAALVPWLRRSIEWRIGRRPCPEMLRELGFVEPEGLGYLDLEPVGREAVASYKASRYDGDVLLVQSAAMWPMYPPAYGWSSFVGGRMEVVTSPGDHLSMLMPPNAAVLADTLLSRLTAADRRSAR